VRVGQTDKRDEDQEAEWVEKVNNRNKATVGFSGLNKHATWAGKKNKFTDLRRHSWTVFFGQNRAEMINS